MRFVLDNSVTMRWFFGGGKPEELAYAGTVLETLKRDSALVPVIWGLEVANVIARAQSKGLVTEARSEAFLEMLEGGISKGIQPHPFMPCQRPFNWPEGTISPLTMPPTSNWP